MATSGVGNLRARRLEERLKWPMVGLALLAIPSVFLGVSQLPEPWPVIGHVLHWLVWLGFASETAALLVVSDDRAAWVRRHKLLVFVVVVSSPLVPLALALMQGLRGVPALKLVGLTKTAKAAKSAKLVRLTQTVTGGKRLLKLGRLWKAGRLLRTRLGLRGVSLAALVLVLAILALGSLALLVEGREYRTPAHGAWHFVRTVAEQAVRLPALGWSALAFSVVTFAIVVAWSHDGVRRGVRRGLSRPSTPRPR